MVDEALFLRSPFFCLVAVCILRALGPPDIFLASATSPAQGAYLIAFKGCVTGCQSDLGLARLEHGRARQAPGVTFPTLLFYLGKWVPYKAQGLTHGLLIHVLALQVQILSILSFSLFTI